MSFAWFIARRYLTARRRQAFISLISAVSIVGVGVGVMALIIALALMTGVQGELRDRIVGSTAHVYVYKPGGYDDVAAEVADDAGRRASSALRRRSSAWACCSRRSLDGVPVQLKGIDPQLEPEVTDIRGALRRAARLEALTNRPENARDGVILGADLAHTLGASASAICVTLMTPACRDDTERRGADDASRFKSWASCGSASTKPTRPPRS